MKKSSPACRFAALALALSFALGAALPALCHQDAMAEHADAATHPAIPCAGACHAFERLAPAPGALPVAAEQRSAAGGPEAAPVLPAAIAAAAATQAPQVRERVAARAGPPRATRPVRLHVYHAVFLN